MLVFSNQRLGPAAELMVSREVAISLLRLVAEAARPFASAHWERELVRWLDEQAVRAQVTHAAIMIDVGDIAFTPQHFDRQRRFLLEAIEEARAETPHSRFLTDWADLIKAHPRDSVQFGRRWVWHSNV
jgi:uncharacterized membrane protein YccC